MILAVFTIAVEGCCGPEFKLDAMQSARLKTPYDTVDYFRTAVRYGDWDAIYDILSPRTKEFIEDKVGRFAFKTWAGDLKLRRFPDFKDAPPEVADLTVSDLVHRSSILSIDYDDKDPRRLAHVQLSYKPDPGAPKPLIPAHRTNFPLVNAPPRGERNRWTLGLVEWMEANSP